MQEVTRNPLADPHLLKVADVAQVKSADRLVMTGVAVSFITMAAANILIFMGDPKATHTAVFWMLGGRGLAQWPHLLFPLALLVPAGPWLRARAGDLTAMSPGDKTAASLGIAGPRFRLAVSVAGALITGFMGAFSGIIGFAGLMMPHLVRLAVGGCNTRVLPLSAFAGAVLMIWANIAARIGMAPTDLPIGIVTGPVGGVFFVWLMARRG